MTTKRCAIYTRVSTDNQAEKEFNSCMTQEQKITSFIDSQEKGNIYNTYHDEGFTGTNTERPALQKLLEDIRNNKIDVILVYKMDRLIRSPKIFYQLIETFDKYKVDFISITERFDTSTPSGNLLRNIMLIFAQFERDLTSERTRDKMLERAKMGLWNGGNIPYGYKTIDKKLAIHPEESEIVKTIYNIYIESKSLSAVIKELNDSNIKNRQHKNFANPGVTYILRNVIYTGQIKYSDKLYPGKHDAIITQDTFDKAQTCHQKNKKKYKLYKNYLFPGIIRCEKCGSIMTPSFVNKHSKKGKLKRYFYYRCTSTFQKGWDSCSIKQIKLRMHDRNNSFGTEQYYELSGTELGLDPKTIQTDLKSLIGICKDSNRVGRNLKIKKFIKSINYSRENIEVEIFYSNSHLRESEGALVLSESLKKKVGSGWEK